MGAQYGFERRHGDQTADGGRDDARRDNVGYDSVRCDNVGYGNVRYDNARYDNTRRGGGQHGGCGDGGWRDSDHDRTEWHGSCTITPDARRFAPEFRHGRRVM